MSASALRDQLWDKEPSLDLANHTQHTSTWGADGSTGVSNCVLRLLERFGIVYKNIIKNTI